MARRSAVSTPGWSRVLAGLALCAPVAAAVVVHRSTPPAAASSHAGHVMPAAVPVAVTMAAPLPRTGWTATADNGTAAAVLDDDPATVWRSADTARPHTVTIDTHNRVALSGLTYLPPADATQGRIGRYQVSISDTGSAWGTPVATGTFADDAVLKTITIGRVVTRFVRLTAITEAGGRGGRVADAEITLLGGTDPALDRAGWTATADSTQRNYPVTNLLDGDTSTFWQTVYGSKAAPLPHTVTIDMHDTTLVSGISYLPRPDSRNGTVGQYRIETSTDGTTWGTAATGAFTDSTSVQTVTFTATPARFVRLTALSEAGNRGPWSSAAEVNLLGPRVSVARRGTFSAPVGFPLVPVAAAQLPNGKILTWSAFQPDDFEGGSGRTMTATYDPATGVVTQRTVTATGHDMFCPGVSVLPDGRVMVTGGNDSARTSIYDPATDTWTSAAAMTTPRGYQSSATLSDGRVFTIGGSWSGGYGGLDGTPHKAGEVWSPTAGWTALPGADVVPMLTADANDYGDYRRDNHAWLFAWSGGTVLQAGPSRAMHWYGTSGTGTVDPAGIRGDDTDAMNGNAVMYDAGKILTLGGAPSYEKSSATTNAYVLTVGAAGAPVTARKVAPMVNARAFANSVVLPDGKVAVFGGENYAVPFSDNTAVLSAELWDPATETFSRMASAAVPRTYHSEALLMPDGRVFTGGGGLCGTGCATNHFDAEIFTPPDLLNPDGTLAARPAITAAPAAAAGGESIHLATDRPVTGFAMIRMGSATHSVDTDQRRIALAATADPDGGYRLQIPADPGVALPGYWMLFALDDHGVPSIARTLLVGSAPGS